MSLDDGTKKLKKLIESSQRDKADDSYEDIKIPASADAEIEQLKSKKESKRKKRFIFFL